MAVNFFDAATILEAHRMGEIWKAYLKTPIVGSSGQLINFVTGLVDHGEIGQIKVSDEFTTSGVVTLYLKDKATGEVVSIKTDNISQVEVLYKLQVSR